MEILSPAFKNNERLPDKYTCEGQNISPPLKFIDVPENTTSLALLMFDPDATGGRWFHWTLWNMLPTIRDLEENAVPPTGAHEGMTSFGDIGYGGPCPPKGVEHRYIFHLYSLNAMINFSPEASPHDLAGLIAPYVLDEAELIGFYGR